MKSLVNCILGTLLLICGANIAFSQAVPDATAKKIDSLFKQWDNVKSPGCAIGIIRNDSLIYAKGYGMANLEYGIPITPESIFEMGSVSKQFTGYAIVLLARQGKLNLGDDIRKYLPWFPDLGKKITIRNLLTHTSGIRDYEQLLPIAGTRGDDVVTHEHILKILGKQQALNFNPGDEEMYSNSGFVLLSEIVRSASGKSLRQFADSAIFKPLGMANTHFHDDYTEIVPNRAYSYNTKAKDQFINSILNDSNAGATGLFTNINDMSKWVMNFYNIKAGDQKDIATLTQKLKLNNGQEVNYGLGIEVDNYKGLKNYNHMGVEGGYYAYISVFPDQKMGFLVFSNLGDINSNRMADQLADLFIKSGVIEKKTASAPDKNPEEAVLKDTTKVKPFVGSFIGENGDQINFVLEHKKLYFVWGDWKNLLIHTAKDTFTFFTDPKKRFVFNEQIKGKMIVEQIWQSQPLIFNKFNPNTKLSGNQLREYTGKYYCPELDCSYGIALKDHHLVLTNAKYNDTPLTLFGNNQLTNDFAWMYNLMIVRNKKGQITGFEVNCNAIQDLWFKKVE